MQDDLFFVPSACSDEQLANVVTMANAEINLRLRRKANAILGLKKYGNPADHLDESDYCRTHDLFASKFTGTCPFC